MNDIKKNFLYNVFYQILILIIPIVTVPYISRVLGVDNIGIYSYTYSIVNYFMLFAMLGIKNYGNRTIAKVRDNKEKLSKEFISIYVIQIVMTLIMILLYLIFILFYVKNYSKYFWLQSINLIAIIFDINWFFFGLEKFKITVTRNTILKILSLILIFTLVKTSNDLWLYILILAGSTLLSLLLLLPFLFKEINIVKIKYKDIKKHIKPIFILFIPVIAISVYQIMDKIMLGSMSEIKEVGYYEQAEKIVSIPLGIITALGTVMMPRISNLVAKGDINKVTKYMDRSIEFMMFLSMPMCFGLISISNNFIPIFLGHDFIKSSILIYYLAVTIPIISFANVIRTQYLIPKEKDSIYLVSVIGGAIINLVLNYILINKYNAIGACIATIFAEFFVMIYQVIKVRKEISINKYIKISLIYFLKALIMFVMVININYLQLNVMIKLIIQITSGIIIYGILNYNYIIKLLKKD